MLTRLQQFPFQLYPIRREVIYYEKSDKIVQLLSEFHLKHLCF